MAECLALNEDGVRCSKSVHMPQDPWHIPKAVCGADGVWEWPQAWKDPDWRSPQEQKDEREKQRKDSRKTANDAAKETGYALPSVGAAKDRRDDSMASVEANLDEDWKRAAWRWITDLPMDTEFMAEKLREHLEQAGQVPHDWRGLGPLVNKAARAGLIEQTGVGRARTSNLSGKPIWRRV